ncbi:MAG: hypothetical protein EHM20_05725 [Alphaproteobacteria bacterium]|nr:MAG: hypothetical protein EHM20_05725 [Alphaproteobacteria bacterium]
MCSIKSVIFVVVLLASVAASARELEVRDKNLKYLLKASAESIAFTAQEISLSIERKKCNEHIIDSFNRDLDSFLKTPLLDFSRHGYLEIKLDTKIGYGPRFGKRATYLLSMYERIKKAKIEEQLNCSK